MSNIGSSCVECNECLDITEEDGKIITSLTADRINPKLDHNLDNTQPMCLDCNRKKSDRVCSE